MKKINYFGAKKRAATLHNKIYPKPEVAGEMDLYIKEQVDNKNYILIDLEKAHQENHQLLLWSIILWFHLLALQPRLG